MASATRQHQANQYSISRSFVFYGKGKQPALEDFISGDNLCIMPPRFSEFHFAIFSGSALAIVKYSFRCSDFGMRLNV